MKKLRIAQYGVTHEHAAGKMIALKLHPEWFDIAGFVDDSATTSPKFPSKKYDMYNGVKRMTEAELFADKSIEAVLVEVTNADLMKTAFKCAEHNLSMHIDKPAGTDTALLRKLRTECTKRGLAFQIGYMFRNNPAIQWIGEALKKGWLGDIFEIQTGMNHNYGNAEYDEYLSSFTGGIMYNLGCHLLDFLVDWMGRPEAVHSFCRNVQGSPEKCSNNCVSILEYPHAFVTLNACSAEVGPRRMLKICGTKGTIMLLPIERFDRVSLNLQLRLKEGNAEYEAGEHTVDFGVVNDRYGRQLFEFMQMIRGKAPDRFPIEHDCLVEDVLLAASGYAQWK